MSEYGSPKTESGAENSCAFFGEGVTFKGTITAPERIVVHGTVEGGGQATVVLSTKADKSVVVLRDLPKLPAHHTWQLWMMDPSNKATSIGLASGDITEVVNGSTTGMATFGLTVEPDGGSPTPTLPAAAVVPLT